MSFNDHLPSFWSPRKYSLSLFPLLPLTLPWSDVSGSHDLSFLNVESQASFFTLLFHFHQEAQQFLFTFAIRVVSSANLRLLIFFFFFFEIPTSACASSNPGFHLMYSAYKLNKQNGIYSIYLLLSLATHSSTLAWKIPWTEEPGRLLSMGLQRVRHDWVTSLHFTSQFGTSPLFHVWF